MFERVHSYVTRTLFPFVRIGIFGEDKPCAILVGLYKVKAIALIINIDSFLSTWNVPEMRMQIELRRLNMNKMQTFVDKYSFCVGFTLIYPSSFFNNGTFC